MTRSEWWLIVVLRFGAGVLLLAAFAVIMPASWMTSIHDLYGQDTLPDLPIIGYLTRSVSAFYAYHGALVLLLSFDVRRYATVIRFMGWANVIFAGVLLIIDLAVGMPWFWTLIEPVCVAGFGAIVLVLNKRR